MKKLSPSLAALLLFTCGTASAAQWSRKSPSGPRPSERSAPAVAAIGGSVYLFGGVRDDFSTGIDSFYDDMFRYDSGANTWSTVQPNGAVPHARAFAASADGAGRMYLFGGAHYGPFFSDLIAFDDLWSYSPASNAWTQISASNAGPFGRAGAAMWIDGDRLYIFGGVDAFFSVHDDLWAYDLGANSWTQLIADGTPGSPPARHVSMHGAHTKHGRISIYGGESIDPATFSFTQLNDTWEYDLAANAWTDVTPASHNIDPPRNYAAAGVIGNSLVLQGGDAPGGEDGCGSPFPQNVIGEVWKLQLNQHRWTRVLPSGDALVPIKRTAAAVIEDTMYVFSGWDFQCPGGVGPGQVWKLEVWAYRD